VIDRTTRFRRGKLPHWEVKDGRYFITVRLADSLPREVVLRLQETHRNLKEIEAQSEQFATLQRQYFRIMEKYLDVGMGACCLRTPSAAEVVADELTTLHEWDVEAPHYCVMPNHWHALIVPKPNCVHSLGDIMKRVKGRTAKYLRRIVGGSGPVWQPEWFDRWIRNDFEWDKTIDYIRNNPVNAGIVARWQDHPWTR
jgi:REP element-mobilizing transposase RayT